MLAPPAPENVGHEIIAAEAVRILTALGKEGQLPQTEMLRRIFFNSLRGTNPDQTVTQGRISKASKGFRELAELVMTPDALTAYVLERCEAQEFSHEFNPALMLCVVPRVWDNDNEKSHKESAQKNKVIPWTQKETEEFAHFCYENPELVISVLSFQRFIKDFFTTLIGEIKKERPDLESDLERLGSHWVNSYNLPEKLPIVIFLALPRDGQDLVSTEITQEAVTKGFQFLDDTGAFRKSFSSGMVNQKTARADDVTVKCPARRFLKRVLVEKGLLVKICETVKSISKNPPEQLHPVKILELLLRARIIKSLPYVKEGDWLAYGDYLKIEEESLRG